MASCACSKLRKVEIVWRFLRHRHTVVGTIVIPSARHVARVWARLKEILARQEPVGEAAPENPLPFVSGFEISDEIGIVGKSLLECMSGSPLLFILLP
jgi:hypothetical protein